MQTIIFACVHNAGRSQMSAAFFNQYADPAKALAISAGTQPAERVHPVVVEAMLEVGVDLRDAKPQKLTSEVASKGRRCSSPWDVVTIAHTYLVFAATIGHCRTQRGKVWSPFGKHGMNPERKGFGFAG